MKTDSSQKQIPVGPKPIGGDVVSWPRFGGSYVMNSARVPTFYEKYRTYILGSLAFTLIASALFALPLVQSLRYRAVIHEGEAQGLSPAEIIQLEKNAADIENANRVTLAQIMAGLILLSGLYFTYQNMIATRHNLRITEEGKLTERFSKSIEMLSSDKIDVRLGGIYALERIARDSEKDHWTVMEVLCAFIRENSRIKSESAGTDTPETRFVRARPDIQAAITVIGRRKWISSETQPLDLKGADLEGCNLLKANLDDADLVGANLKNTFLGYASLNHADLRDADFAEAFLEGTNLNYADLTNANFDVDLFFAVNIYGAQIPDTYPKERIGNLEVARMCIGLDHHKHSNAGYRQLRHWHKRFGNRRNTA